MHEVKRAVSKELGKRNTFEKYCRGRLDNARTLMSMSISRTEGTKEKE